jgi:hypothetical protein
MQNAKCEMRAQPTLITKLIFGNNDDNDERNNAYDNIDDKDNGNNGEDNNRGDNSAMSLIIAATMIIAGKAQVHGISFLLG